MKLLPMISTKAKPDDTDGRDTSSSLETVEEALRGMDEDLLQMYIDNGRRMNDVLGLSLGQSLSQLPEDEANDEIWPYIDS